MLVLLLAGAAAAAGQEVSIPSGPFADGQTIVVTGSGFPPPAQAPAGLQIIECSDPQGTVANLPIDATSGCEGVTVNPGQVNTDKSGSFRTSYRISTLSASAGTSSIDCDSTHLCVLWIGTDYNNAFSSGPHAFTKPFAISGASPDTTSASVPSGGALTTTTTTNVNATAAASTQAAEGDRASLAYTGVPGFVLWLSGAGGTMTLLGFAGRRLVGRRSR